VVKSGIQEGIAREAIAEKEQRKNKEKARKETGTKLLLNYE